MAKPPETIEAKVPCPLCESTALIKKTQSGQFVGRLYMVCRHCTTRTFGWGPSKYLARLGRNRFSRDIKLENMTQAELRDVVEQFKS